MSGKCKCCASPFRNRIESMHSNGVPGRVIEHLLLLNGIHISNVSILRHMRLHTNKSVKLKGPASIEAAQSIHGIDPYESVEAHDERILMEKYKRDGATDAELVEGVTQAAIEAEKAKKQQEDMLRAFAIQASRQAEGEAYEAFKRSHEYVLRDLYEADKALKESKTKGEESRDA